MHWVNLFYLLFYTDQLINNCCVASSCCCNVDREIIDANDVVTNYENDDCAQNETSSDIWKRFYQLRNEKDILFIRCLTTANIKVIDRNSDPPNFNTGHTTSDDCADKIIKIITNCYHERTINSCTLNSTSLDDENDYTCSFICSDGKKEWVEHFLFRISELNGRNENLRPIPIDFRANKVININRCHFSWAVKIDKDGCECFSDNRIGKEDDPIAKLPSIIRPINWKGRDDEPHVLRWMIANRRRREGHDEGHIRKKRSLGQQFLGYFNDKGVVSTNKESQIPTGHQIMTDRLSKSINSVDVPSGKTHLRRHRGKRRKVGVRVIGVEGSSSLLPCDITSQVANDAPLLLMWFKEGSHTPLFSVDFRDDALKGIPQVGRDMSSPLPQRARLHVTIDSEYYKSNFLKATNNSTDEYETFISSGGNMEIKPTKRADEGIYKCRVDFLHSPTRNERVNLTVIIPPHSLELEWRRSGIWHQPSGDFLKPLIVGESLHVVCKASPAWPPPLVIWSTDGVRIDETFDQHPQMTIPTVVDKTHKILTGAVNHLQINRLQRSDHLRKLTCRASNNNLVLPTTRTITLSVALPVLSVNIGNIPIIDVGESMFVQCTIHGSFPPPLVNWMLGDDEISASQFRVSEDGNTTSSVVKLTPRADQNGLDLMCQAYNPILQAHKHLKFTKIKDVKKIFVKFAPSAIARLGKSLDASRIKEGDDVYFECIVKANPSPHLLYWIHNGKRHQARHGAFLSDNTLVIQGVTIEDSGNYSCIATNTKGQDSSNIVQLKVKFAPLCAGEIPSKEFSVAKYEKAMIYCNVSANPSDVIFRWSFNNTAELVDVPRDRYSSNGSFSVLNYTPMNDLDYGTLLCWGSNEVGKQIEPCVFHIKAAGKPEPPHNCQVIQTTISSLRVTCLPGSDGGDPQVFHLQVQKMAVGRQVVAEISNSSPDFFAANLQPSVRYRLLITAANKRGESHPPKELLAKTAELKSQRQETNAEATRERKTETKDKIRVMMGITLVGICVGAIFLSLTAWAFIRMRKSRRHEQMDSNSELQKNNSAATDEDDIEKEEMRSMIKVSDETEENVNNTKLLPTSDAAFTQISETPLDETEISSEHQIEWEKSTDSLSKYQYSHKIFTDVDKS